MTKWKLVEISEDPFLGFKIVSLCLNKYLFREEMEGFITSPFIIESLTEIQSIKYSLNHSRSSASVEKTLVSCPSST